MFTDTTGMWLIVKSLDDFYFFLGVLCKLTVQVLCREKIEMQMADFLFIYLFYSLQLQFFPVVWVPAAESEAHVEALHAACFKW